MSRAVLVSVLTAALGGCSLLLDTGGLTPDGPEPAAGADASTLDGSTPPNDASGPSDAAAAGDAAPADAGAPCPSGRGPAMKRVTDEHGTFCVDTTEVTNAQFDAFLADTAARPTPPMTCKAKTSYGGAARPANAIPVTNVDWCDAWMFCAWAGKRLCGSRNGTVINDLPPANDTGVSEWFAACSHSGSRNYPYGTNYDANACNGCRATGTACTATQPPALLQAGALATCTGGYDGLLDMSGNVAEWEDNCDGPHTDPGTDTCPPRGGSVQTEGDQLKCAMPNSVTTVKTRLAKGADVGIRCCAN